MQRGNHPGGDDPGAGADPDTGDDDAALVRQTLRRICRDAAAPAAARAQAARTLAEMAHMLGRSAAPPAPRKAVADMTRAELEAALACDPGD